LNQVSIGSLFDRTRKSQCESDEVVGPHNLRIIQQIGKGSFGDVYLVEKRSILGKVSNGPKYAMKVLPKSKFIGHNLIKYALTERNILSLLNHPFIVKLRFAF
jgi:serine/threonine protein kinase